MAYGLYNFPELNRQAVGLAGQLGGPGQPGRAVNPYGDLRAAAEAQMLQRRLEYQKIRQQGKAADMSHKLGMAQAANTATGLRLDAKRLKHERNMLPWVTGLGLAGTLFGAYEGRRRAQLTKEASDRQSGLIEALIRQHGAK